MCEYCNRKIIKKNGLIPLVKKSFPLFGDACMEIFVAIGDDEYGNIEEFLYLSGYCIAKISLNYCPMCGRQLIRN